MLFSFLHHRRQRRHMRRRAGSAARERYRIQRKAWLREHRLTWWLLGLGAAAVTVAFSLAMHWWPGDQAWACGFFAGSLLTMIVAVRDDPPGAIQNWQEGAWGEEMTATELDKLARRGWTVLNDLPRGVYNIDHVVVGPRGVFCLNSKKSACRLEVDRHGRLTLTNRYDDGVVSTDERTLRRVRGEAADVARLIEQRTGQRVWVTPVMVWWGPFELGRRMADGVLVVHGLQLLDALEHQAPRSIPDAAAVAAALDPVQRQPRQRFAQILRRAPA